ncbi:MAG: branched-chain amino acid ABC transporter permease [Myxococcales bacterium]|nr:branched-chain amino acid ABC transporter permease [Myxococcales bacterium]
MMGNLIQLLAGGLSLGAAYALVALGFVVIYRASTVLNFAHMPLLTTGAFLMVGLCKMGVPWGLSAIGAMVLTGALAAAVERGVMRPMIGKDIVVTSILTIFVAFFLEAMVIILGGVEQRGMPTPWDTMRTVPILGAKVLVNSLVSLAAGLVALGGFFALINYTKLGVAMRAAASDQEASLAHGIPVGKILSATWFFSGVLAGLGGIMLGMFPNQVDPLLGTIALRAFPAIILGGLESPLGAVLAGFIMGILEVLAQAYLNPALGAFGQNFHGVFPYLFMILVLIVRPHGLFGVQEVKRA